MQTLILLVAGIASLASLCKGQFDNPLLMMHLLTNGGGASSGSVLSGGGMFGGASNLAMAGVSGMTGNLGAADLAMLTNGVKFIVGQHAMPSLALIRHAAVQDRRPSSLADMVPYASLMVELAKDVGLRMQDGSVQFPIGSPRQQATNAFGRQTGITLQRLRNIVNRRTMEWFMQNRLVRNTGLV